MRNATLKRDAKTCGAGAGAKDETKHEKKKGDALELKSANGITKGTSFKIAGTTCFEQEGERNTNAGH